MVLTTVRVEKNEQSITASQLDMGHRLYVDMAELRFLGYELADCSYRPGDAIQLGLYWRAPGKSAGDYAVNIQLRDSADQVVYEQSGAPAEGTFPTDKWNADVLLDWHDLKLPASLADGTYKLRVGLTDGRTGSLLGHVELPESVIVGP